MSFSKLHEAALRFRLSKSKVIAGSAILVIAAYSARKYGPKAFQYIGLKTDRETVGSSTAEEATDGSPVGQNNEEHSTTSESSTKKSTSVNRVFYKQLRQLLRIIVPGLWTKEFALLMTHTASLVSRTFLSVYVAQLDGHIVKAIVQRDVRQFVMMLALWLGIAVPATFVNSLIRFLENQLGLALRSRLVQHAYQMYFNSQTYYRLLNKEICPFFCYLRFSFFCKQHACTVKMVSGFPEAVCIVNSCLALALCQCSSEPVSLILE